jgi:hypothetical protein
MKIVVVRLVIYFVLFVILPITLGEYYTKLFLISAASLIEYLDNNQLHDLPLNANSLTYQSSPFLSDD